MTNTLTILLILNTNWSGYVFQGKELGFVATNHVAQIVYQGETNTVTLKTTVSDEVRWRPQQWVTNTMLMNINPHPLIFSDVMFNYDSGLVLKLSHPKHQAKDATQ